MLGQQFQLNPSDDQKNSINLTSNNQHHQPKDSISCIRWIPLPDQYVFCCTTWGGELLFYQYVKQQYPILQQIAAIEFPHPLLTLCWRSDGSMVFFTAGDGSICSFLVSGNNNNGIFTLDVLSLPAIGIFWVEHFKALLVITIDGEILLYNVDNPQSQPLRWKLDYAVNCCDFNFPLLALGLFEQKITLVSIECMIKNTAFKFEYKSSPLGTTSQLKSIMISSIFTITPSSVPQQVISLSSLDGRGNISKLSKKANYNSPISFNIESLITFKGHKEDRTITAGYYKTTTKQQDLYPINDVVFNIKNSQFIATLGSDGKIVSPSFIFQYFYLNCQQSKQLIIQQSKFYNFSYNNNLISSFIQIYWDYNSKNKICDYSFSQRAITCGSFSYDGNHLAFGIGYDWNQGLQGFGVYPASIHVLNVTEKETFYKGH